MEELHYRILCRHRIEHTNGFSAKMRVLEAMEICKLSNGTLWLHCITALEAITGRLNDGWIGTEKNDNECSSWFYRYTNSFCTRGAVTELDLSNNNLVGTLPVDELSFLSGSLRKSLGFVA